MACVRKRRDRWVIDFYDQRGKRRLKTLPRGVTKAQANKILREIQDQVEQGIFYPAKNVPTFANVADQWLALKKLTVSDPTYKSYECHVRLSLKPFFEGVRITDIRYDSVADFLSHETKRGCSVHPIRKSLVLLGSIMKFAVRNV